MLALDYRAHISVPLAGICNISLNISSLSRIGDAAIYANMYENDTSPFIGDKCARCHDMSDLSMFSFLPIINSQAGRQSSSTVLCSRCRWANINAHVCTGEVMYILRRSTQFIPPRLYALKLADSEYVYAGAIVKKFDTPVSLIKSSPGGAIFCLVAGGGIMRVDKPVIESTKIYDVTRDVRGFARDVNTVCLYAAALKTGIAGNTDTTSIKLYDLRTPEALAVAFNVPDLRSANLCVSSAAFSSEHLIIAVTADGAMRDNHTVIDIRAPAYPVYSHPFHGLTSIIV